MAGGGRQEYRKADRNIGREVGRETGTEAGREGRLVFKSVDKDRRTVTRPADRTFKEES